jgi:mannosyltransferase
MEPRAPERSGAPAASLEAVRAAMAAVALAALHVAVKAPRLGNASLWLDEAFAVHLVQRDPAGVLRASRGDTSPPLYDLVLWAWQRLFGMGEAAARWPSVVASAATAAVLFLLARRHFGAFAAWCASALFLLSDVNLHFARQARPYALATLLAALSLAAFLKLLDRATWPRAALVAGLNLLLVFTHYVAVLAVVAEGLALLWPRRDLTALRRFAAAHLPVVAALAAWVLPVLRSGQQHKMEWMPPPNLWQLGRVLGWYADGRRWPAVFLLLLAFAVAALLAARRRGEDRPWGKVAAVAIFGLAPIPLAFAASYLVRSLHPRYLLFVTPALALLWALGLGALRPGRARTGAVVAACLACGVGFGRGLAPAYDWRAAVAAVRRAPVDRIVVVPWWEYPSFAYYFDPVAFRDPEGLAARLAAQNVRFLDRGKPVPQDDLGGVGDLVLLEVGGGGAAARRSLAEAGYSVREREEVTGVSVARLSRRTGTPR